MKKLVVIACAALAVVSAKAATVDWKYEISGAAGGSATEFTGYTVYLVDKTYYDGLGGEVTKDAITSKALSSDTIAQTGKSGKGANTKYVFTGEGSYANDSLTKGTSYDYYLVLVNGDNYYSQAYSYTARDGSDSVDAEAIATKVAPSTISSGMTPFYTGGGGGGGETPAPEPTSGLLLLVGGAMLALRRKQK